MALRKVSCFLSGSGRKRPRVFSMLTMPAWSPSRPPWVKYDRVSLRYTANPYVLEPAGATWCKTLFIDVSKTFVESTRHVFNFHLNMSLFPLSLSPVRLTCIPQIVWMSYNPNLQTQYSQTLGSDPLQACCTSPRKRACFPLDT